MFYNAQTAMLSKSALYEYLNNTPTMIHSYLGRAKPYTEGFMGWVSYRKTLRLAPYTANTLTQKLDESLVAEDVNVWTYDLCDEYYLLVTHNENTGEFHAQLTIYEDNGDGLSLPDMPYPVQHILDSPVYMKRVSAHKGQLYIAATPYAMEYGFGPELTGQLEKCTDPDTEWGEGYRGKTAINGEWHVKVLRRERVHQRDMLWVLIDPEAISDGTED